MCKNNTYCTAVAFRQHHLYPRVLLLYVVCVQPRSKLSRSSHWFKNGSITKIRQASVWSCLQQSTCAGSTEPVLYPSQPRQLQCTKVKKGVWTFLALAHRQRILSPLSEVEVPKTEKIEFGEEKKTKQVQEYKKYKNSNTKHKTQNKAKQNRTKHSIATQNKTKQSIIKIKTNYTTPWGVSGT